MLAHGYIDPAFYVRGQGMTRERGYLASRGYIALHVDYRNHAESDDDPRYQRRMRLGYTADVINAVKALRGSSRLPVDDDRIALFGRSMGGGVILKALVAAPGLVAAAAPWASVSSLEAENYASSCEPGDPRGPGPVAAHGPPAKPAFWRANSSRPYFDRITEPVLMVHGRFDDTCPPPLGDRDPARVDRGRRRRAAASGTTTATPSARPSPPRWTAPCGSSTAAGLNDPLQGRPGVADADGRLTRGP